MPPKSISVRDNTYMPLTLVGCLQWGGQQMGDKLVAAPLRVDDLYFHFLISAREPYSPKPYTLSTLLAYVKHIRRYGDSDSCEDLTFDDPPATVAVSVAL